MSDLCPVAVSQDSGDLEEQPETALESQLLLWKSKQFCDVTFTFPNLPDRIEAHEFCLMARSPVFQQLFRMRKSGNVQSKEIEISESTPERFQQFLEFIYSDKFEVDIAVALDLVQLAQKYKIQPLIKKCEDLFKTQIRAEHSVKVFETARRYGRQELMDRAVEVLTTSFLNVQKTGTLWKAQEETISYLLEQDELAVEEVKLFEFILKWGRKQARASGVGETLQNKLKNVLSKIRYTSMTLQEFTQVVVPTGLLTSAEELSVYHYFGGNDGTRKDLKISFNTTRRKPEKKMQLRPSPQHIFPTMSYAPPVQTYSFMTKP